MEETKTIEISKNIFKLVAALIAVVGIFMLGELFFQFQSLPQNASHEINVTGEGKAYAKPDVATINFGVHSEGQTSQEAVSKNNAIMDNVIKAIKGSGVQDKDIQTTLYNLSPNYQYQSPVPMMYPYPGKRTVNGYSLDQQIQVKIRNFDKINEILEKASSNGANTIGELQFTVDDIEKVKSEARAKAIAEAKEKANSLFAQSGLSGAKLVNVSEGYAPYPQPLYGAVNKESATVVAPQIQTGQQEVDVTVTLTYVVR